MKLLVVTDNRFWRKEMGSQQRISEMLSFLSKKNQICVHFVGILHQQDHEKIGVCGYKVVESSRQSASYSLATDILSTIKNVLEKCANKIRYFRFSQYYSPNLSSFYDLKEIARLRKTILEQTPDCILFEYLRLDYLFASLVDKKRAILTVIDTHDVSYQRHLGMTEINEKSDLTITKKQEVAALSKYDIVIAIQQKDFITYKDSGLTNVVYAPHAISFNALPKSQNAKLVLGFIGSSMQSNILGINNFIDKIFSSLPDEKIELVIAGSVCDSIMIKAKNLRLLGRVEFLEDFYRLVDVTVNPIYVGSGLKIKSVESICFNRPIISSIIGIEGMPRSDCAPFIVCENDDNWVDAIYALTDQSKLTRLSSGCEEYATSFYSISAAYGQLNITMKQKANGGIIDEK